MNMTSKAALAVAAIVGLSTGARADLTVSGAVGLPLNPTAQIPEVDGVRLQANYTDLGSISAGGASLDNKNYGLFGAGRIGKRIEISGGMEEMKYRFRGAPVSNTKDTGIAVGAKYLFTKESDAAGVRLAGGIGYDHVQVKNSYAYLVATKYLGKVTGGAVPVTAHLGVRYDRFDNGFLAGKLGAGSTSFNKTSAYAGVEVPFMDSFQAVGEIQSKRITGGRVPYSVSVRYRPQGCSLSASLGYQRDGLGFGGPGLDGGLFAQLGYTFDTHNH